MNYYKRHLGDYARDTGWLTTYQHGVYALLLDWYYANEKPIPADLTYRIVKARSGPERRAVDEVVSAFFDVTKHAGFVHNKRADLDVAKYKAKAASNSLIALERESTKRARNVVDSCADSTTNGQPSHKPLATNHKKEKGSAEKLALPDWLPADAWSDWHKFRNASKGWTPKARELSLATLTKLYAAGHQPKAVIDQSIERGWTGLFPVKGTDSRQEAPRRHKELA